MKVQVERLLSAGDPLIIECDSWEFCDGVFSAYRNGTRTAVITDIAVAQTVVE